MEPEGVLDGSLPDANNNNHGHLCDAADEEVHFSRFHVHLGQFGSAANWSNHYQQLDSLDSSCFSSLPSSPHHFADINLEHNEERAKSSRLLTSLGSKLRRGSNYYLAAPKLVGQYLLGITTQSWCEFLDTSRMRRAPCNAHQLTRRLVANLNHFQGNYLCVSLVLIIYCILTSPCLLLAIVAYLASLYAITARTAHGRPLRIANFRPNLQQQYSFVTLVSLPLLWVAGAPSAVFWVIGASFVVVGLHASMYSRHKEVAVAPGGSNGELHSAATSGHHKQAPVMVGVNHQQPQQALSAHILSVPNVGGVHYYNHFGSSTPLGQQQQHQQHPHPQHQRYLAVPGAPVASANKPATAGHSNRYTSALAHWITFGSMNKGNQNHMKKKQGDSQDETPKTLGIISSSSHHYDHQATPRVPDVTIISQDYAGLGRVYEI